MDNWFCSVKIIVRKLKLKLDVELLVTNDLGNCYKSLPHLLVFVHEVEWTFCRMGGISPVQYHCSLKAAKCKQSEYSKCCSGDDFSVKRQTLAWLMDIFVCCTIQMERSGSKGTFWTLCRIHRVIFLSNLHRQ